MLHWLNVRVSQEDEILFFCAFSLVFLFFSPKACLWSVVCRIRSGKSLHRLSSFSLAVCSGFCSLFLRLFLLLSLVLFSLSWLA